MDYKYIEQLIERYFACETTLEEERILREFFVQADVPQHLHQWQPLFKSERTLAEAHLDEKFDQRIIALTGQTRVKAHQITLTQRLYPLYKAAAVVAVAILLGTAVEHATVGSEDEGSGQEMAVKGQDELDEDELTTIDIKSAEATGQTIDTLLSAPRPTIQ